MKKIAIFALISLIIIASIFSWYLYSSSKPAENSLNQTTLLQEKILNNSSWTYLSNEDLTGYINGTYTPAVQSIVSSLEEAIPVIFKTQNGKFKNSTYIVASAFDTSNNIYVYSYNKETDKYSKTSVSLESLLEDAIAVFIYNGTEGI